MRMPHWRTVVLSGLTLCFNQGLCQTAKSPTIHDILDRFLWAAERDDEPSAPEVKVAALEIQSPRNSLIRKAACAFCLAMADVDREQNVRAIVADALRSRQSKLPSGDGGAEYHLPNALFQVLNRWNSRAAASAIASLSFKARSVGTGGLASVRNEAFVTNPSLLASTWIELPSRQQASLPRDLAKASKHAYELSVALHLGANSNDPAIKRLSMAAMALTKN